LPLNGLCNVEEFSVRSFIAFAAVLLVIPFAFAQDDVNRKATQILLDKADEEYRTYFKRPESTFELWAAIKFEIDIGKFDLAALHLKRLLENDKVKAEQVDEDLFKIEGAEGSSSFLRMLRVQRWSDHAPFQKEAESNLKTFFDRLNGVLERKLSDATRINKFINQLDAETAEERTYAFTQLNRSRERAIPYLIEKLQESLGKPLFHRIVEAMVNFDAETVPAYLEVLKARNEKDARDQELRLTLLRILRQRGDERVVPYLWHLSASRMYPPLIRETAQNFLVDFLKVDKAFLPAAKLALVELSDRYFKHQVKFPERLRYWKWDGSKVSIEPMELKAADAEELFGVRYALEALDLDPAFVPAQLAFLNMTVERTVLQDFEHSILKPMPPATQRLLATLDPELILRVQERAYEDANIPVILGTMRALGDRGETRAAKPSSFGLPQGIVRGLYFPDRRVQFQAVNSLLKMPTDQTPVAAARTVEALQRLVTVDQPPAALVVGNMGTQAEATLTAIKEAGLTPLPVRSVQEAFTRARSLGNVEAVIVHYGLTQREIPYALTQLKGDIDLGLTPVVLVAPSDMVPQYQKLAARFRNVKVLSEALLPTGEEVKKAVDELSARASIAKLTAEERKAIAARSLDIVHQMARNQIPGYDVRPTLENVALSIGSPDFAPIALEILGRLPGSAPQIRLADVVLDPSKDKLRVGAARELNRQVQSNGPLMPRTQFDRLRTLYNNRETEVPLRTELSYFIGSFPTTPSRDGAQISQFRPDPAAVPPMPVVPAVPEKKAE
jgi:hypothetical protein